MRKCLPNFKFFIALFALMLVASGANALNRTASTSGNWNSTATWGGLSVPVAGDDVFIPSNLNVTVTANAACTNLTFTIIISPSPTGTLTVNAGFSLAVSGIITKNNETQTSATTIITGGGTLSCGTFTMCGTNTAIANDHTVLLTTTIAVLNINGNLNLNGEDNGNDEMSSTFDIASGTVTVTGTINIDEEGTSVVTLDMNNGGAETGVLILPNATPFTTLDGGLTFDANGTAALVNYSGTAQTIFPTTYKTLTFSGSGIKSAGADFAATGILTINSGVTLQPTADIDLLLGSNLVNNGVLNSDNTGSQMDITFNGTTNQSVTGTGTSTEFNRITINNTGAANNNIVEIIPSNYSIIPAGFLTLTQGILKLSGTSTIANTFFTTANYTIDPGEGIWLNNTNATVTGQANNAILDGLIRVTLGTYNVGTAINNSLRYNDGSVYTQEGGTVNIAGKFIGDGVTNDNIVFNMSGGTLNVANVGNSTSSEGSFDIGDATSSFTMSGGTIIIRNENTTTGTVIDYRNIAGTLNVTGGTVQFATVATPGSPTFVVGVSPTTNIFPSLSIVKAATATTVTLATPISVRGNLDIAASTTLNAANQAIAVTGNTSPGTSPGNWTNNGTFTPGTQTVTFNGNAAQIIGGANTTAFSSITFNNNVANTAIGITISKLATVAATASFVTGIVSTDNTNYLSFLASSIANGSGLNQATDASYVTGPVRKTGSTAFIFPVGSVKIGTTGGYMPISIGAPGEAGDVFEAEYTRNSATNYPGSTGCTSPLLNVSRCDYWNLNEITDPGNNNSLMVTLSFDNGSPCGTAPFINNLSGLTVAHYTGPKWDIPVGGGATSTSGTTTTGTVSRTLVTVFSPFSLGNTNLTANPLPVLFNNVKAYEKGNAVQIEWTNLTEKDVVSYSVERSADGYNFTSISQFGARSNISDAQSYFSIDNAPAASNIYRIKVVEADGHIVYSKLMRVDIGKSTKGIVLYPNPVVGNDLSIGFTAARGQYNLSVMNAAGQQIYTQKINHAGGTVSQAITLPVSVKTGIYNMLISGDNYKETKMFVIQ